MTKFVIEKTYLYILKHDNIVQKFTENKIFNNVPQIRQCWKENYVIANFTVQNYKGKLNLIVCVWVRDGMLATYISLKHIYAWFGLKGSIYFCLAKKLIF